MNYSVIISSVHLTGLFNRVIAQSGTAFGYWALAPNDQGSRNARKLALSVNCSTAYTEEMVKCLKKVDAFEIAEHQHSFYVCSLCS